MIVAVEAITMVDVRIEDEDDIVRRSGKSLAKKRTPVVDLFLFDV